MKVRQISIGTAILLLTWVFTGCGVGGSTYGIFALETPKDGTLYFRREARGLNYDALFLTANKDVCAKPDDSKEIRFIESGTRLFYKFDGYDLHLYVSIIPTVPTQFTNKPRIIFHQITNPEFINLRETYASKGFQFLDVPLNESLKCG
jgi:hypothetical protein